MTRTAIVLALALLGCESEETTPRVSVDATNDVSETTDAASDAVADTAHCCPIGERACCMLFGGSRENNPSCGMVCDNIPDDLEQRIDDAGCPYWYDPPGGGTTCNPAPPDTGTPDG